MYEVSSEVGPGSLLWHYAGDWRAMLPGSTTGVLQLMHPAIGAGVAGHSAFFDDPFDRIYRSIPQIWATIFEPDGERRGRAIRDLHRDIKGADDQGRRYHALDGETFWWAHATFTWNVFRSVELFHLRGLDNSRREQLYQETVAWYRRYGMSMRPVPHDYRTFAAKFEDVCRHTLEMTPAAARALSTKVADLPANPLGPRPVGLILGPVVAPAAELLVVGCMPPSVRRRFDMPWTGGDRLQMRGVRASVRQGFRLVPYRLNTSSFQHVQRRIGARTRDRRYR